MASALTHVVPCIAAKLSASRSSSAVNSAVPSASRSASSARLASRSSCSLAAVSRRAGISASSKGRGFHVVRAAGGPPSAQPAEDTGVDIAKVKEFLGDLPPLGDIRLIVNTGVSVLESVTTFEGLFYSPVPGKGEYANLIKPKENVDFHLLISKVASVKFETAQGRGGNYMSYVLRVSDIKGDVCVSLFLMWPEKAERGQYAPGQARSRLTQEAVEAFQALQKKWVPNGDVLKFKE